MDPGSAPQQVGQAHGADQLPDFERYLRSAAARSRLPSPEQGKPKCACHAAHLHSHCLFHPWHDELTVNAVHLGWVSGARYPEGNDWVGRSRVLARKKAGKVIVVLDHDDAGRAALPKIAQELHIAPFALRFPCDWLKGTLPGIAVQAGRARGNALHRPIFLGLPRRATWQPMSFTASQIVWCRQRMDRADPRRVCAAPAGPSALQDDGPRRFCPRQAARTRGTRRRGAPWGAAGPPSTPRDRNRR
jgi:hypothetical protein